MTCFISADEKCGTLDGGLASCRPRGDGKGTTSAAKAPITGHIHTPISRNVESADGMLQCAAVPALLTGMPWFYHAHVYTNMLLANYFAIRMQNIVAIPTRDSLHASLPLS